MGGASTAQSENSPTLTMGATQAGVILGSAAYMAPEQARGKEVDRRADIWAFGVVLYEMLTGQKLFQGDDLTETLASVIKEEPKLQRAPAKVQRLLRSCLEKDPKKRLQAIGDWRLLLDEPAAPLIAARQGAGRWIWPSVAALFLLALAALALVHFRETPPAERTVRFQISVPEKFVFNAGTNAIISPDGRWIAFPSIGPDNMSRMYLRALDSLEVKPLEGSEGGVIAPPPSWSFDSRFIVYASNGKLRKSEISGGPSQIICDASGVGAGASAWNRDGVIVFVNDGGLRRVSAAGGTATPATVLAPGESAHRAPQFLPDGRHFLYHRMGKPETTGVYVGSLDAKPEQQSLKPLLLSDRQAEYAPSPTGGPGWLLFMREGSLMAQRFDADKLELSGDPVQVAPGVGSLPVVDYGFFSVSETGALLYRGGAQGQFQLTWTDAQGNPAGTLGDPGQYLFPAISPDGSRVAVAQTGSQGNIDIWVLDVAHGNNRRLTFDPATENFPVWTPDGKQIVFTSDRGGHRDLYMHAADGSGEDQLLLKTDEDKAPEGFSRDGRYLLYSSINPKTRNDIWILPMEGDRKPVLFLRTEFNEMFAQFSPDGRWIAYESNESGSYEVYVKPFSPGAGTEISGGKFMVSKGGGVAPQWRGKQLLYTTLDGRVMAVDVTTDKTFQFGVPKRLFQAPTPPTTLSGAGDISYDGKRFLFIAPQGASNAPAPFTVVLNWFSALKK
jgi:eukaryotic-like serine/threonine-protein kinase